VSVPKLISPILDNFIMGDPISDHNGVRCCPAMEKDSEAKYIVKVISIPSTQAQLDALLLSGAYTNADEALNYFKSITDGILAETRLLEQLSQLNGFIPFENCQVEPMEESAGYDVYLLNPYCATLEKRLRNNSLTQLDALNLGLDLCSALSICRQSGYLYVNLKPGNIYITNDRGFRIGDLGFLRLNSLKYASLPDRYRSVYTAPEITDAYSELNGTIDVYAAGLILYQVYNNGTLPFTGDTAPAEVFAAPSYADYEMAEIILKACAPNPEDRWQDPESLGQALVSYMQRNGANDVPIIPIVETESTPESPDEITGNFEVKSQEQTDSSECSAQTTSCDEDPVSTETSNSIETTEEQSITESDIFTEDSEGNLTFLSDDEPDETLPNDQTADVPDAQLTEEVSDMLQQADELIAHQTPDPVVQPEPIDVPVPVAAEETESEENDTDSQKTPDTEGDTVAANMPPENENSEIADPSSIDVDTAEENIDESEETAEQSDMYTDPENIEKDESGEEDIPEDYTAERPRKRFGWFSKLILLLLVLALIAGGIYYYKYCYIQTIHSIELQDDSNGTLTVILDTTADESNLSVTCTKNYGYNKIIAKVEDGKAIFTDLVPDTAYTIEIITEGFHRLTGETSTNYTFESAEQTSPEIQ